MIIGIMLVDWLKNILKKRGHGAKKELSEVLGIDPTAVSKILIKERELSALELQKVANLYNAMPPGFDVIPDAPASVGKLEFAFTKSIIDRLVERTNTLKAGEPRILKDPEFVDLTEILRAPPKTVSLEQIESYTEIARSNYNWVVSGIGVAAEISEKNIDLDVIRSTLLEVFAENPLFDNDPSRIDAYTNTVVAALIEGQIVKEDNNSNIVNIGEFKQHL